MMAQRDRRSDSPGEGDPVWRACRGLRPSGHRRSPVPDQGAGGHRTWLHERPASVAPDLGIIAAFSPPADAEDAFYVALRLVQEAIGLDQLPDMTITVTSDIPIAGGLGSGAAISAALVRALAEFLGRESMATDEWVSGLTYEVEKIHHGTPSGIDNTVVTYERPVYFRAPPDG